jgi:signal-transduction protein with cAMP-binding, CBS, and nucleotidyltransferase domain
MIKTGIKILDAMTKSPVMVGPDETVYNCVKKMIKEEVGSLIIAEDGKLLGIVTEKDLLVKVLARNLDIKNTVVSKVMSKKPIHADPELDLYDAMILMNREELRRLPIVDKGIIVGLLTYKDVLTIQPSLYDLREGQFNIRESERKSMLNGDLEGTCVSCSSYGPLKKVGKAWLCESCKR